MQVNKYLKYENRILAYLDILGFKDLLKHKDGLDQLHHSVQKLQKTFQDKKRFNLDASVIQFSDCIIISTLIKDGEDMIDFLFGLSEGLATIVESGIIVRGALTYGKYFSQEDIFISPAFVRAYQLEQDFARYPRVIIDPQFESLITPDMTFISGGPNAFDLLNFTKTDIDGFKFLDYLGIRKMFVDEFPPEAEEFDLEENDSAEAPIRRYASYKIHKSVIETNLKKADTPAVVSKYVWLANYYNSFIKLRSGVKKDDIQSLLIEDTQLSFGIWDQKKKSKPGVEF